MENLEKEIINRLNKILNKYNLEIISKINHNYKTTISVDDTLKKYCSEYNLVEIHSEIDNDITIIECYYTWKTIKSMLLESLVIRSLFDTINSSHNAIKHYIERGVEPPRVHLIIDKLYNEFVFLNNCTSYEELAIKMDLIGI